MEKIQHSVSGARERSTEGSGRCGEGIGGEGGEDEGVGGGKVVLEAAG